MTRPYQLTWAQCRALDAERALRQRMARHHRTRRGWAWLALALVCLLCLV